MDSFLFVFLFEVLIIVFMSEKSLVNLIIDEKKIIFLHIILLKKMRKTNFL